MKIIAYIGPKNSGKDACAKAAIEAGLVEGVVKFAGPLKSICSDVFGIPLSVFEDMTKKEAKMEAVLNGNRLASILFRMHEYITLTPDKVLPLEEHLMKHEDILLTSPRHILQYVGTEIIRAWDEDWHCKAAFSEEALPSPNPYSTFAVTDCRFLNEYYYLKGRHDTEFHYVHRPEAEAILAEATHASELGLKELRLKIENTINNTGTLEELAEIVRKKC